MFNFFNQKNAGFIFRVMVYCLFVFFILGGGANQIVLPGPVKIATTVTGQPSLENACGGLVFKDSGLNNCDDGFPAVFQPGKFILEGKDVFFSSIVEVSAPLSAFAEEVVECSADQGSARSDYKSYDVGFIHWLIGVACGCFSTCMGMVVYNKILSN